MRTYEVRPGALSAQGHAFAGQQRTAAVVAAEVGSLSLPGAPITVATELAAYSSVWGDGLHALARELDYLGGAMVSSASSYSATEAGSARRYRGAERLAAQ